MKTKSAVLNIFTSYFAKIHENFEYPVVLFGANMHLLYKNFSQLFIVIFLVSCGGGGGGGGGGNAGDGYGNTNNAPTINNSSLAISVIENQTSAFTVSASDPDGDSISFSISDNDSALFNISTGGVVTFITAPDFEIPTDANADNVYTLTVQASDGSLSDSKVFDVTVTNDTADDVTSTNFDGVLIRDGYIQSATVCMAVTDADGDDTCEGATYSTTTNADGSFTLEIDDNITATIKLLAEDGFNPVTDDADSFVMGLIDPTTEQNLVISPLSTLLYVDNRFSYESLKEKLGVDSNFMVRFDDPYLSINNAASNKAALVNTQLLMMYEALSVLQSQSGASNLTAVSTVNDAIFNRDASTETSLGDTTLVRDVLLNLDLPNYTVTNTQLENLSGSFSSFLQKVYVDSNNEQAYFSMTARDHVTPLLKGILDDTVDSSEIDQIMFDTLQWVSDKSSRTNLTDVEDFRTTSYTVGNSGSAYYTVDGVNADSTALVIYAKVGDTIVFEPTSSSVFAGHPFEISTSQNDTAGNNNIGSNEGWSQSSNSLTVTADTPTVLYPHCGVHSGMYTNGRIEIVTTFDQSKLDINQASGALEVNGTVSVGPFKGASGFTHKVYLRTADAGDSQHAHEFKEYPGITFYMPAGQGYHGQTLSSGELSFKTKSHY
ncbi:cadherin repeat domain-containing protein [Gammaproteobacteria bacterium]|nr:cadherin repeat domain-containing protein [Gammaproteobacteria bacterium]